MNDCTLASTRFGERADFNMLSCEVNPNSKTSIYIDGLGSSQKLSLSEIKFVNFLVVFIYHKISTPRFLCTVEDTVCDSILFTWTSLFFARNSTVENYLFVLFIFASSN